MYSAAVLVALAGSAVAQGTYGAAACPAAGETSADGRYSCNPAHSYPEGQLCTLSEGCYYLRIPGPGVSVTASVTASVGEPVYRTETSSAPSASATCPAAGETGSDGRYSCNPAHSYPEGQLCTLSEGCYYLRIPGPGVSVTESATASVGVPVYRTSTSSAPSASATCPAAGETSSDGRYSCNPAHSYPEGQLCTLSEGCYYLRIPGPGVSVTGSATASVGEPLYRTASSSASATESFAVDVPEYRTTTVSAITTYCPQPTTFVHSASTYVVTKATTLTVPCPGGCVVTKPATVPGTTAPVARPTGSTTLSYASKNGTATHTIATYTGAGVVATGAPLAAMAALGAFLL